MQAPPAESSGATSGAGFPSDESVRIGERVYRALEPFALRGPLETDATARILHVLVLSLAIWYGLWSVVLLPLYPNAVAKLPAVALQEAGPVAALLLLRLGFLRAAGIAYLAATWAFTTLVIAQDGGIRSPVQVFYVTLPVLATWLLGYRGALWTAAACMASALVFAVIEVDHITIPRTMHTTPFGIWAIQIQVILIGAVPVAQILKELGERTSELRSAVAEKSRLLREVERSEEQFHMLADTIAQLAWMADGAGRVTWRNRRWIEFAGTGADHTRPWGWNGLIHPNHRDRVESRLRDCIRSGEAWEDTFPMLGRDGSYRWFLSRAIAIRNAEGAVLRWFGTSTDITEQKWTEDALRRSNEDLEQFAFVASHDLREPLRNISTHAQLLSRAYATGQIDTFGDVCVRTVIDGALRMDGLITGLLTYARATMGGDDDRRIIDLGEPLSQALANLAGAIQETGADIAHDPLPSVSANPIQMVQVFQNLLANALKYRRPRTPPRISIGVEAHQAEYVFSVRDNGEGFNPEYSEKVFGIFKRLHGTDVPGTGIGLAICKAIITRHGGRIWAQARPGEGAVFSFTLPRLP